MYLRSHIYYWLFTVYVSLPLLVSSATQRERLFVPQRGQWIDGSAA